MIDGMNYKVSRMEVFEAIQKRKSVRAYEDRPIPEDVLMKILEAGRIAPSAANRQPWHFVVVRDPERRKALTSGRWAKFLKDTPVVIVGCGDKTKSPRWFAVDVTIALENIVLAATAEGVGTCWIGSFEEEEIKKVVKAPAEFQVVAMLAMGYPRKSLEIVSKLAGSRNRNPIEEIVSYEEFGKAKGA